MVRITRRKNMLTRTPTTFSYEGIVYEQQASTLCVRYKDDEAVQKLPRIMSFFTKFKQKGIIRLSDDDIEQIEPYSLEGKKVRVKIEVLPL